MPIEKPLACNKMSGHLYDLCLTLVLLAFFGVIVEWSVNGKFVAVAKESTLSILSSKFKERLCVSLSFKSWVDDSDVQCRVKGKTNFMCSIFLLCV